ncbi:PREDICTED: syndecan-1 [Mandrillus leucophaeus]|uniref:Syndecan n=1 Tax=Mandrillus leucophaeus TaxID=9568 RepID=A0A2K5YAG2_MANLE|nr:PREDICTED: syndecan-1 [Mandrillus leucophaeus]
MRGVSLCTCAAQGRASPLSCLGEDPGAAEPRPSLYSYHILILFQQIVATNLPPEDQDGSGDDSDNFSGSGAGALQDITLSQQTPSTWKDTWLLMATPTSPEPTGLEATAASTSTLPAGEGPKEGEAVVLLKVEPELTAREQEATPQPTETTQLPTTHQAPTARATTAQEPATSHPYRDMQPGYHETSAPAGPGQADLHTPRTEDGGPSATERAAEDGASSQLPAAEGSGEQDFTFETSGENTAIVAVEPDHRNQSPVDPGATGASQGLLDRKEVLGGIIAGGLVGLIFAVCLVGFMLYRMKKKDEGSYSLEEPKQANGGAYQKPTKQEEFYA